MPKIDFSRALDASRGEKDSSPVRASELFRRCWKAATVERIAFDGFGQRWRVTGPFWSGHMVRFAARFEDADRMRCAMVCDEFQRLRKEQFGGK